MTKSRENTNKYKNTILLLCAKLGGSLYGKKKLAKLLYFVDFDRYEFNESLMSVTGDIYEAWPMGPVPMHFGEVLSEMIAEASLKVAVLNNDFGYHPTEVYTCLKEPDISLFDGDDLRILNRVIQRYGRLSGKQLEELSHAEAPYIGTKLNDEIPYELSYYRETDFSDALA